MPYRRGEKRVHQSRSRIKVNIGDKERETVVKTDNNNPIIQQFRSYSQELLEKQDRTERIIKLCRDITIESKRVIFLLHTIDTETKHESVLSEAKQRLDRVKLVLFKGIAHELKDEDLYQYLKAYKPAIEEFVEAITFYQYLESGSIRHWTSLEKELTYSLVDESEINSEVTTHSKETTTSLVTPHEYILGLADLTGELMRRCVNNLAIGDIASCYQTCTIVRDIYKGFLVCSHTFNREINRKLCILKQSLRKIENVCYTIKVRGSEVPKHILVDAAVNYVEDGEEAYEIC